MLQYEWNIFKKSELIWQIYQVSRWHLPLKLCHFSSTVLEAYFSRFQKRQRKQPEPYVYYVYNLPRVKNTNFDHFFDCIQGWMVLSVIITSETPTLQAKFWDILFVLLCPLKVISVSMFKGLSVLTCTVWDLTFKLKYNGLTVKKGKKMRSFLSLLTDWNSYYSNGFWTKTETVFHWKKKACIIINLMTFRNQKRSNFQNRICF